MMRRLGLQAGVCLLLLLAALLGGLAHAAYAAWAAGWGFAALLAGFALLLAPLIWLADAMLAPLRRLLRALEGSVLSYRDGDFSMSLAASSKGQPPELAKLLGLHSELGLALREQRQQLAQRELLLDTVVQNTPIAMLLCNPQGRVSYANIAARQLLSQGRSLAGAELSALLVEAPEALAQALHNQQDQLIGVIEDGQEEQFHISQRSLLLQGQAHRLVLIRRMTRELSRQEVASWKRVIRVMSHELNNSLAPISSLAHSGAELARRGQIERLEGVFNSIGGRAKHLHQFLSGYAGFAKLPLPLPAAVAWHGFLAGLSAHCQFTLEGEPPGLDGFFDAGQIEQALINLIKNAHEAGGPAKDVSLNLRLDSQNLVMTVADRGPGMSETVLAQALLPFYSTKRQSNGGGTGLGLALAREIAEAHGGRITLANRSGGGLAVSLWLPNRAGH